MERLLKIGFRKTGAWILINNELSLTTVDFAPHNNALYVFVSDGIPMYVGKTTRGLKKRLGEYVRPGPTQSTNIRNKILLEKEILSGKSVEIFFMPDEGLVQYGDFSVNLAAALEDSIIKIIDPLWNGGKKEMDGTDSTLVAEIKDLPLPAEMPAQASFEVQLYPTYYKTGFFNVGISHTQLFGTDGEMLTIFLGNCRVPVEGTINRTANNNGSPRLMGYTKTRDWLQRYVGLNNRFTVRVLSPISINIVANSY